MGEFAEWAEVHGNFYGTRKKTIHDFFNQGKNVLLDIDVQGAAALRTAFPKQSFLIFLEPPSIEALEKRLRLRGTDSEETIQKRIRNAQGEMSRKSEFDLVLVNDDLDATYGRLKYAVNRFLERTHD